MERPAAGEGTGRRAGLDRDDVVAAALDLIEQGGAAALSMRKLAAELGVTTNTIYWHVGGRDELLVAAIERLSRDLAAQPVRGRSPRERVLAVARRAWDNAFEHRRATALAHEIGATSLLGLPLEVALAEELEAAGLRGEAVRDALRAILMCTAGFLVVALRRHEEIAPHLRSEVLWADVPADVDPETRAALQAPPDVAALFEATLRSVVASHVPAAPDDPDIPGGPP
ncbi:MAG: TetR family transcriptional regulator [Acidimicrobiales bacterium]|nr:TetR family transcriptional regulator [Actinomycetota bacterium]